VAKEAPASCVRPVLEVFAGSSATGCPVEFVAELYAASEQKLLERLRALPESADSVMLIWHNPGLQELALVLTWRGVDLPKLKQKFPTGALATLVVDSDSWEALRPGDAELVDYVVRSVVARESVQEWS
jgi:phosphohistidine phosphatase